MMSHQRSDVHNAIRGTSNMPQKLENKSIISYSQLGTLFLIPPQGPLLVNKDKQLFSSFLFLFPIPGSQILPI